MNQTDITNAIHYNGKVKVDLYRNNKLYKCYFHFKRTYNFDLKLLNAREKWSCFKGNIKKQINN